MEAKQVLVALALLACLTGCAGCACDGEPDPKARLYYAQVRTGVHSCSAVVTGPNTVVTVWHCLENYRFILVDGVRAELVSCNMQEIPSDHRPGNAPRRDGACELRLSEPRAAYVPMCDTWPAGAQGTLVHREGDLSVTCLDEIEGRTACSVRPRKGTSGTGLLVGDCVAGVLAGTKWGPLGTDPEAYWIR